MALVLSNRLLSPRLARCKYEAEAELDSISSVGGITRMSLKF